MIVQKPIWDIENPECLHALYKALASCESTLHIASRLTTQFDPANGNPKGITHSTIGSSIRRGRARAGLISVGYDAAVVDGLISKFTQGQKVTVRTHVPQVPVQRVRVTPPPEPEEPEETDEDQTLPLVALDLKPVRLESGEPANTLTLNESMCRFPIGEPGKEDFAYCGRGVVRGAYCADHARLSYQPKPDKNKKRKAPVRKSRQENELARLERMNRSSW